MKPYYQSDLGSLFHGDCLDVMETLPDKSINCGITSPPYWGLRDYGEAGQLGLEKTPEEYVKNLVAVFHEFKRVLRDDGTLWLNLGDSYIGYKGNNYGKTSGNLPAKTLIAKNGRLDIATPQISGLQNKNLVGIPWRVAFALQADGWYLRQDIIWSKPNPMPESVTDRCTKSHEYIFLLSKSPRYYYDNEAIKEASKYPNDKRRPLGSKGAWEMDGREQRANGGGVAYCHNTDKRNKRSVWTVTTKPFKSAHFATFPPDLILPCVLAGCPEGGVVMDMFSGAGTTPLVAIQNNRNFIAIDLSKEYCDMQIKRLDPVTSQARF